MERTADRYLHRLTFTSVQAWAGSKFYILIPQHRLKLQFTLSKAQENKRWFLEFTVNVLKCTKV